MAHASIQHSNRGAAMTTKRTPFDRYSILWSLLNLTSLLQLGSRARYAVQPQPTSTDFRSAPTNYLGAAIFISYIVAALMLAYAITRELNTTYRRVAARKQGLTSQWKQFRTFAALSAVSFAVLSFNMLSFLVTSYRSWSSNQDAAFSQRSATILDFGTSIWHWTVHSTLFLDFAQSLCASQPGYWWVMQALMATMVTNVIMQSAGRQWKVKTTYYVGIGQILPISFAMNLFSVALVLAQIENEKTGNDAKKDEKVTAEDETNKKTANEHTLLPLWTLSVVMILYRILLFLLPRTPDEFQFMAMVLLTRLALYTVCLIRMPMTRALHKRIARSHLAMLRVQALQQLFSDTIGRGEWASTVAKAWSLVESPAVAALSMDYVLWFLSVWSLNNSGLLEIPAVNNASGTESIW